MLNHNTLGTGPRPHSSTIFPLESLRVLKESCSQGQLILVLSAVAFPRAKAAEAQVLVAHHEQPGGIFTHINNPHGVNSNFSSLGDVCMEEG